MPSGAFRRVAQSVPRDGIAPRERVYSAEIPGGLLTLDEAAGVLRVSKKTLRRRIDGGELDVVCDPRLVLVPRASLLAYVARHTVRRPAEKRSSIRSASL